VLDDITAPLYEAAGAKPFQADALELEKRATDTRVDPHPYVGEYESVVVVFRVIPYEEGIALRLRLRRDSMTATHSRRRRRFRCARWATATSRLETALSRSSIRAPTAVCSTWPPAGACTNGAGESGWIDDAGKNSGCSTKSRRLST
jgi:hypothetical protein